MPVAAETKIGRIRLALVLLTALSLGCLPGPDLVVSAIDLAGLVVDGQVPAISGQLDVDVENSGNLSATGPIELRAFEDRDGDEAFDPAVDVLLGNAVLGGAVAAGAIVPVTIPVSGQVLFGGNRIFVAVDTADGVSETNENNNVRDSGDDSVFIAPPGPFAPQLEWSWTSTSVEPNALNVMMTPSVIDVSEDGIPDVVFASTASRGGGTVEVGFLRAISGADGSEIFTVTDPALLVNTAASVATGDIDGDGLPEIIACDTTGRQLIAFENDGSFKWRSAPLDSIFWGAPSIADLDQDGTPEIISGRNILDATGAVIASGSAGLAQQGRGPISVVADVDLDGSPEIVAGNTLYDGAANVIWQAPIPDGVVAVGNLDLDPEGEIVHVEGGRVRVLHHDGTILWGPVAIPGGGVGGPPTIADYDNDGLAEIGVAGAVRYVVFETDGTIRWSAVTQDRSSNRTGSSVFDFDGDGAAEVVYRDELFLRVYSGLDGSIRFETPMSSCTWYEYVLVADVDADGNAEIVAVANDNCGFGPQRGVFVYGDANDNWVGTRPVWNQHAYHITNVGDDGTIPAVQPINWLLPNLNNFRLNTFADRPNAAAPDLVPSLIRQDTTLCDVSVVLEARVGNGGSLLVPAGVLVSFYDGDPLAGGSLIGTTATSIVLRPGEFEDVAVEWLMPITGDADIHVVVDDDGTGVGAINEGREDNNAWNAILPICREAPSDVTSLRCRAKPTKVNLTWNASPDAASYQIWRESQGMAPVQIGSTTGTVFADFGLQNDVLYTYFVQSTSAAGVVGALDATCSATPRARDESPGTITVPSVVFLDQATAEGQIVAAGLLVGAISTATSASVPAGDVISQLPVGGASVPPGTAVSLVVSLGPPNVIVPDVVGLAQAVAQTTLTTAGLTVGVLTTANDPVVPAGAVISQLPAAGSSVPAASAVDLVISLGPAPVTVPDVVGLPQAAAESTISAATLAVGAVTTALSPTVPAGNVISQNPPAGSSALPGSPVDLVVSIGPGVAVVPDVVGLAQAAAETQIVMANLTVGAISTAPSTTTPAGDVISQSPVGGATVVPGSPVDLVVSSGPAQVFVPDVVGQAQAAAEQAIVSAALTVGAVTTQNDPNVPAGDVISQNPTAGTQVAEGSSVDLVVSLGPLNTAPVADAGPDQTVLVTDTVTLDGSGSSDTDGDPLTFLWQLTQVPPGSGATLSDPTAVAPTFVADLPGTYVAELVVDDGTDPSAPDVVIVSTTNSAPVADAGPDQTALVNDAIILDGSGSTDVDGDPLTYAWQLTTLPAGSTATLDDPTAVMPGFVIDVAGTYVAELVVNDGLVGSLPDTVTVTTTNSAPVADAGPDQSTFVGDTVTLDGSGSADVDGDPLTYSWSLTTVPAGSAATLDDPTRVDPTFQADLPGTYVAQLMVNDGFVDSPPDTVVVTTQNSPPVADAGPDQSVDLGALVQLDGTGSSDVDGDPLTYAWSLNAVPSGSAASLSDPTSPTPTFTADVPGDYVAQLIVNDGLVGGAPDTVLVSTLNVAPVADAGPDQTVAVNDTVTLDGSASSDVDGDPLTFSWSLISVPAGSAATLSDPSVAMPDFVADVAGSYVAQLVVNDGLVDSTPDTVTISTANGQPLADAGGDQAVFVSDLVTLDGSGSSDPDGDPLTFAWSLITVPAGSTATLSDPGAVTPEFTPDLAGTYVAQLIVNDGTEDSAPDTVSIDATDPPLIGDLERPAVSVTANPPAVALGSNVTLTVVATDDVGVVATALSIGGANVPLDAQGMATFSSATAGIFEAVAIATDAAGNQGEASAEFRVLDTGDVTPPTVAISSPADEAVLMNLSDVIGTASDANLSRFLLELSRKGANDFAPIAMGTASVTAGLLGQVDPGRLRNGLYDLRLTAEDTSGNVASTTRSIELDGEAKVGNFSISFDDLELPVAGLPILITRTYDSRVKTKEDFGVGWSLAIATVEIEENRVPGSGWQLFCVRQIFTTCLEWGIEPSVEHRIVVTRGDGRKDEFLVGVNTTFAQPGGLAQGNLTFSPLPGTQATLQSLDAVVFDFLTGGDLADFGFNVLNPDRYLLTDPDGTAFVVDQAAGVQSITDPNGNSITIGPGGIIHSGGKSVVFARDADGRITTITDPLGNVITYAYDFYGDLVSVTDQEGNVTRFTYNSTHGLVDLVDPRGSTPPRNIYDASGALVAHVDANGNMVQFASDPAARQEVVTDRLGRVTVYDYDANGNVTTETNALGDSKLRSYDANGNMLTETNELGETTTFTFDSRDNMLTETDGRGFTTTFTYDAANRPLTTTDPNGNLTTYTYNTNGELLTSTDALGNVASSTYDTRGLELTNTNCLGDTTTYTYDADGNQLTSTDPLGSTTTYTYDANGNVLTESRSRTTSGGPVVMTITYEYDGANRLVRRIDPDGSETRTEYNAIGKQSATIDKNGRRTEFSYDLLGNLVTTLYPDGTTETATYDANGNRLTSTDRGGRTTTFEYDALDRLFRTTAPDGGVKVTAYDAAGQVASVTDEAGNATSYTYFPSGLTETVTDPLGFVTSFEYDDAGNQTRVTDALGNVTDIQYDALNRRVRTDHPDGTFELVGFDCLGQRTSTTDQNGLVTQFAYDAVGNMTQVTNTAGEVTTYTYDEVGNQLTQTDANGSTTSWTYDDLGRVLTRTLPLGMVESFTYNADGTVQTRTDFDGDTTLFTYDGCCERLIGKEFADTSTQSVTYTATGMRDTVTDARGVTTYTYDTMDRLLTQTNPDGSTLTYTYDLRGLRTSLTTSEGTTTHTYDALGRMQTVMGPDGGTTTYGYDAVGNRATVTYPNGTVTSHFYDSLNRLTSMENRASDASLISAYVYTLDNTGRRQRVVESGPATTGRQVDYVYDGAYRLLEEQIDEPGTADDRVITYTHDATGNRLTRTVAIGTRTTTTTYVYDANDRLTSESEATVIASVGGGAVGEESPTLLARIGEIALPVGAFAAATASAAARGGIAMTAMGVAFASIALLILLALSRRGSSRSHLREPELAGRAAIRAASWALALLIALQSGPAWALVVGGYPGEPAVSAASGVALPGDVITYTWDANGNRLTRAGAFGVDTYSYDFEDRLLSATLASGPQPGTVDYEYDFDGIRVSRTQGGSTTDYLVDTNRDLAQVVTETTGGSVVGYVTGDDLVSREDAGGLLYYLYDGHLSTRHLSDASEIVTDTYTYDAFGVPLTVTGTSPNDFLYAGEQFDATLGHYYLRARYYAPATGRFLTMDTFAGRRFDPATLHKYTYSHADPVNLIDPSGNFSIGGALGFAGGLLIGGLVNAFIGVGLNALNPTKESVWGDFGRDFAIGAITAPVGGLIGRILGPVLRGLAAPVLRAVGRLNRITLVGASAWQKVLIRMSRVFVTTNAGYPPVQSTLIGRTLKTLFPQFNWQQHHIFIQQAWFRPGSAQQLYTNVATNRGLARLGNAGWNLMPIPGALNGFLGRSPVATQLFATFIYSVAVFGPTQLALMIEEAISGS